LASTSERAILAPVFTGLIEARVPVSSFEPFGEGGTGARLVLPAPRVFEDRSQPGVPSDGVWATALGESIAVSGVCLTVVEHRDPGGAKVAAGTPGAAMVFDLSAETLDRSWFRALEPGRVVNLERSLRLGDRLGGHMVQGHVDGTGAVVDVRDAGDGGWVITFELPPELRRYVIEKGSIAIDGISLTVVSPRDGRFDVAVIPKTLELTSLGEARPGDRVNLEVDPVGKWIERLLPEHSA
jgi:riboflavin synthase